MRRLHLVLLIVVLGSATPPPVIVDAELCIIIADQMTCGSKTG